MKDYNMILPGQVRVVEVGPRDGFQNQPPILTEIKYQIIAGMIEAGVKEMEITSFVSPKAIPQMADAKELAARVVGQYGEKAGLRLIALVPNLKGAQAALESGLKTVSYVISASERHSLENVRKTTAESFEGLKQLLRELPQLFVRLDIATAFGCPFLGSVPEENVLKLAAEAAEAGVGEIILCDTIGVGNPLQVYSLAQKARGIGVPMGLHLHDTRGLGLANTLAGLQAGVAMFETSVAALGGCPFAPGASGNTATEDLLNMLTSLGLATGISMERYLQAVDLVIKEVLPTAGGHLAKAPLKPCC